MFDGLLSRDDWTPEIAWPPQQSGWSWELTALVLVMLAVGIAAAVLFPGVVAMPLDTF
jgi:hypothetical protein